MYPGSYEAINLNPLLTLMYPGSYEAINLNRLLTLMYPGSYEALNLNPQSTPHDYVFWILWSHKLQSTPHTYVALNLNLLLTLMYLGPYKALNLNHPPPFHFSLHPCVNIRNRMNRFRNIYYIGHLKICFICRVIHKIISLKMEDLFGSLSFFAFLFNLL